MSSCCASCFKELGEILFLHVRITRGEYGSYSGLDSKSDLSCAHLDSQFRCQLCRKDLNLGNMGQRALLSHLGSKNHAAIVLTMRSSSRLSLKGESSNSQSDIRVAEPTNTQESEEHVRVTSVLERMIVPNPVTEAEIRRALKIVQGHASFNSCSNSLELFWVIT